MMTDATVYLFTSEPRRPLGTGFIIAYPCAQKPGLAVPFVVTAKHVVENQSKIFVVFAKTNDDPKKAAFVPYDLDETKRNRDFFEHPDGVDVVAFRFPIPTAVKFEPIPYSLLASPQTLLDEQIHPTDHVVFPSLLAGINYSVVRTGAIARMPDPDQKVEMKIPVGDHEIVSKQEMFLINATAIPGASGSPLFLSPEPRYKGLQQEFSFQVFLLGLIQAYASSPEIVRPVQSGLSADYVADANAGIAIVVPAWHIREIMERDAFNKRISELTKD